MFVSNPFFGAFGVDISDLSIKLVQLRKIKHFKKAPTYKILEMRAVNMPPGYIVNGEIQQPEMVRKKLLYLIGKDGGNLKKIYSPWVAASLPEPQTFLKLIDVESEAEALSNEDVLYQARKHLPFDLEEAYLDWNLCKRCQGGQNAKVLVGAAYKTIADSYTYLLESVGLQPITLEVEAVSLARAMMTADKIYTGEARAILDLGATRSSLIIFDNNSVQFSTSLDFSGELINTAVTQTLKIEHNAAEKIKIELGFNYSKQYGPYLKAVNRLVEKLTDDIKKALVFYKEHFKNTNPVTHITMCGGVSNWNNLAPSISRTLKISAEPGNAWKNLGKKNVTDEERARGLTWAPAIGLALLSAHNPLHD